MNILKSPRQRLEHLLEQAGITINGKAPQDIILNDESIFKDIQKRGSLGLGEAYMAGKWTANDLSEFFNHVIKAKTKGKLNSTFTDKITLLTSRLFNLQSKSRAFQVGQEHYDIGDDIYKAMLDPTLTYTCAYWKNADNLNQAQLDKLDLSARKLKLQPGQRVLDIGCGWGSMTKYLAENHNVEVVGLTISENQAEYAQEQTPHLPVEIRLQDYREIDEQFDRIVSLGMFEHVGPKNYREFFKVVERNLKQEGIFLLHTIGNDNSKNSGEPWINKYIFPNGVIPSQAQIAKAADSLLKLQDVQNFGRDYDKTLTAWNNNFQKAWQESEELKEKYSRQFKRMWEYYLQSCAGAFRAGSLNLFQNVYSKGDINQVYESER